MDLSFRLVNAFADPANPFSGNPVCVFDDASGLTDEQMNQLALQVNDECVFLRSSSADAAQVQIIVPSGGPKLSASSILAAAQIVSQLHESASDVLVDVDGSPVRARKDGAGGWTIPAAPATTRKLKSTPQILSSLVGLSMDRLSGDVMVIESTRSGVVLPVSDADDVRRTRLDARMLQSYAMLLNTEPQIYVWAHRDQESIESRMFVGPTGGVVELAATGTGAANLGAWLAVHQEYGRKTVYQGAAVGRPSVVNLDVKESGQVIVGGSVRQVAAGAYSF